MHNFTRKLELLSNIPCIILASPLPSTLTYPGQPIWHITKIQKDIRNRPCNTLSPSAKIIDRGRQTVIEFDHLIKPNSTLLILVPPPSPLGGIWGTTYPGTCLDIPQWTVVKLSFPVFLSFPDQQIIRVHSQKYLKLLVLESPKKHLEQVI